MPTKFSGRDDALAISPIGRAEVLVAKMQWSGVTASMSLTTLCLRSMSSKTASMTMSAAEKCFFQEAVSSDRGITDESALALSCIDMRRLFCFLPQFPPMYATPFETDSSSRSLRSTRYPFSALTCAIPAPMSPAPTTAMVDTGWSGVPNRFFFTAVIPSKSPSSALCCSVSAHLTNCSASNSSAFLGSPPFCPSCRHALMAGSAGKWPPAFAICLSTCCQNRCRPGGVSSMAHRIQSFCFRFGLRVPSASWRAWSTATVSSALGSRTRSTRPIFFALSGRTSWPIKIMVVACWYPTSFGRFCVPPHPGNSPSFTSGRPSLVFLSVVAIR
mmetsp:Transcript_25619/g.35235  ORF Transcript_25619/g.35235 Transcript_25619/m.35235 type:complete len:330 (+) Transcript_25619:1300-2289(+)